MCCVVGRNDNACADRLLTQEILKNPFLNPLHDVATEKSDHGQIHSRIHQTEGIASSYHTIERRQVLEATTNYLHLRMRTKLPLSHVAKFFAAIDNN